MVRLPLIVGMGGINSAGRSSGFHSYKRMIADALSYQELESTWFDLANRMGIKIQSALSAENIEDIKAGTLIRKINNFDPERVPCNRKATLDSTKHAPSFITSKSKLPVPIPLGWEIEPLQDNEVRVTINGSCDILVPGTFSLAVTSGGNIPSGFDPGKLYNSHHHPRGLKLTLYGACDALNSLGIKWDEVLNHIKPDEVAVYAGSALSQVDENSLAGLFSRALTGNRVTSKMMPLSLAEMPADFINSYIINSVGKTGTNIGACATFLYNLKQGMTDIQTGSAKVVIVGNAEAPLVPDIIEGFRTMGALATDDSLRQLDQSEKVDQRRACRPFSTNSGFTLSESAQFVILMNDELALELGANIYGSVADIFINADANKKSISSPGVGNYVTIAKAAALAKSILGKEGLKKTYVQAHGTGTPQNRTTESHILNEVAKTFSIPKWPITAIKSYVGHSVGVAAGDQLIASLGVWQYGWIPGIKTISHIAQDVHQSHLNILMDHYFVGEKGVDIEAVLINSKGFGGNNATGLILSPHKTMEMLQNKYGKKAIEKYKAKNIAVSELSNALNINACNGHEEITYKFGKAVMDESSITMTESSISLSEFIQPIELPTKNDYTEYC
jgi:acetoacetyl-[acyl-carrier protein] synthase